MFEVFYSIGKLFKFIKDTVVDNIVDCQDRQDRRINDIAYVGKDGLQSYETGHSLSFINSHIYLDNKTMKTVKVPLSKEDIEKEQNNKAEAIQKGYGVYKCCDYYLPDNVIGYVYKGVEDDRLYVLRNIKNSLTNKNYRVNSKYYISIMPDNFGHVERDWKGNKISGNDLKLKDYIFKLDQTFWNDDNYIWRI